MAVMDCHQEIHKILGENKYGRIIIEADMKADGDHFSYENQGSIRTNSILMLSYFALIFMVCKNRLTFDESFSVHSPHWYCIIAMGC